MFVTHQSISDSIFHDNSCLSNLSSLISSPQDWKNIQAVVKNAFKLVADTFFMHESQIDFLISELSNKASKSEVDTKLTNKPSNGEIAKVVQEITHKLDSKIDAAESVLTIKDMERLEDKFVAKREYSLYTDLATNNNLSKEIITLKQNCEEIKSDVMILNTSFNTFTSSAKRQISEVKNELFEVNKIIIEKKVGVEEFKKALEGKANKQSVATALHRKANKQDVDEEFKKILRTSELDRILQLLENKASNSDIERLDGIVEDMNSVLEELNKLSNSKLDKDEVAMLLLSQQSEANREAKTNFLSDISNIKEDIELLKVELNSKLQSKADSQSIVDINALINRKADNDRVCLLISQNKNNLIDILENYRKEIKDLKENIESLSHSNFKSIADMYQDQLSEVWRELERMQKQRDVDLKGFKSTANQLYEAHQAEFKENEYKKVLKDIRRLGQSLEEIENVMVKEVCSKSANANSILELKQSMLSSKNDAIIKPLDATYTSPPAQTASRVQLITLKQEIIEELSKQKEEIMIVIENVRNEIYDSLDDTLQNHVNALEQKKLFFKEGEFHSSGDTEKFTKIFNFLSKDIFQSIHDLEEVVKFKVDISLFDERVNNIIEAFSQLEAEIIYRTEANEHKDHRSIPSEGVNDALKDVYQILNEKNIDKPMQIKGSKKP